MKKAVAQILSGNVLSKGLGLLRELLMAKYFGTAEVNGAYRISQTGTLVPINFLTSDSLNSAFIPLYKNYLKNDVDKARVFKWSMFLFFFIFSILLFCLLYFNSGFWVDLLAPGVDSKTRYMSVELLKIMAVSCPFYLCSALINYISMAHGNYKPMALRSSIQNIGMLIGVLCAFWWGNYLLLAWGFTFSYIFFCLWSLFFGDIDEILSMPNKFSLPEIKQVIISFWNVLKPLLLMPLILQGNIILERALSSFISLDAVSALDYAKFITETVLYFLSVPIAFVGLSTWASLELEVVKDKLNKIYIPLLCLSLYVSFFLLLYSEDIIYFLFHRGKFDESSVITTALFVKGMSIGLWAQVIGYIFIKALNSHLKNKQVFIIMCISLVGNSIFNTLIYKYWGAFGIGLGNSIYGILLLIGSAIYMKVFRMLWRPLIEILTGVVLYYLIIDMFPILKLNEINVLYSIVINALTLAVYLFLWCMLFSDIRFCLFSYYRKSN